MVETQKGRCDVSKLCWGSWKASLERRGSKKFELCGHRSSATKVYLPASPFPAPIRKQRICLRHDETFLYDPYKLVKKL